MLMAVTFNGILSAAAWRIAKRSFPFTSPHVFAAGRKLGSWGVVSVCQAAKYRCPHSLQLLPLIEQLHTAACLSLVLRPHSGNSVLCCLSSRVLHHMLHR
jgi:hypothetical protein